MRRILIIPVLLLSALMRVVFHTTEMIIGVPYHLVQRLAEASGSISKMLIEGGRYAKTKKQPGAIVGSVTSGQPEA